MTRARCAARSADRRLRLSLARIIGNQSLKDDERLIVDYVDEKYTFGATFSKQLHLLIHGTDDKDDIL